MEEKVLSKTAVKRTTRKRVVPEGTVPRVRAVRKTAEVSTVRKAPTRTSVFSETNAPRKGDSRKLKVLVLGTFLFSVLLGVSALIGMSDKGELDVASAIAQRKQNASPEEKQALESVPTDQVKPSAPNGGLVGMGAPEPAVVPEVSASSTAETASSTTESGEGGVSTEGTEEDVVPETPTTDEPQATFVTNGETVEA